VTLVARPTLSGFDRSTESSAIRLYGLRKVFGSGSDVVQAVDGVSLDVADGEFKNFESIKKNEMVEKFEGVVVDIKDKVSTEFVEIKVTEQSANHPMSAADLIARMRRANVLNMPVVQQLFHPVPKLKG